MAEKCLKSASTKVPPDGGYGWAIVCAYSIFFAILYSMGSCFGLMYKHKFDELDLSVQQISFLISCGFFSGTTTALIASPLIKYIGCRWAAIIAGVFHVTGLMLSAYARNYLEFLLSYSVIEAMGYGFGASAYLVSISSYFVKKRAKALSIALTLTGFGTVIYPPLITTWIDQYGGHATIQLAAALSLHTIFAALLLQPVEWHMVKMVINENLNINDAIPLVDCVNGGGGGGGGCGAGADVTDVNRIAMLKLNFVDNEKFANEIQSGKTAQSNGLCALKTKLITKLIDYYDLTLLVDMKFVNLVIGIAITDSAESTYFTMTPLMLQDKMYSSQMIAGCLSTIGFADIMLRFSSSFIGDYFHQPPKLMYMYSLLLFIISRTAIYHATTYTGVLIFSILNGIGKGIMYVYWNVVVSACVPIERLAAATGIIMITNGLFQITIGPIIGYLRDKTGNYAISVFIVNVSSGVCLLLWAIEMLAQRILYKQQPQQQQQHKPEEGNRNKTKANKYNWTQVSTEMGNNNNNNN